MKNNNITKLALKLAGVYMLIQAILYLTPLIAGLSSIQQDSKIIPITFSITFVLLVVLGLILVLRNKPKFDDIKVIPSEILQTGISVGGIILFTLAIKETPLLITKLVNTYFSIIPIETIGKNYPVENLMPLVGNLIQLILGLIFFLKAKFFSNVLK